MTAPKTPAIRTETSPAEEVVSFLESHRLDYSRQVLWFMVARVVVALACLAILLIYEEGSPRIFAAAYVVLVFALGVAALQLGFLRVGLVDNLERYAVLTVCLDVGLTTALAYLTGGIYMVGFAFLYFASILSAVLLVSDRAGFLVSSVATVALALTAVAYWFAHHYPPFMPPFVPAELYEAVDLRWGRITANLIGVMIAFHGVAFLAARLPYRLSQARLLYDEILERMGEGVVAIDRMGRIILANAEARRLLNWQMVGSLVGRRFEDVLRRREDRHVLEVLARDEEVDVELELKIRDRDPLSVEVKTTVFRDERHRVRGVVGIFRDLSLKKLVEEMEIRLARLADTEEIALGIAHEIRNPLGSIRGAVQELASHSLTDEADQRLSEIVQRESSRLDRIIQQFLDFARMRPPLWQKLDLNQLVEETAMLLERRPEAEGVTIDSPRDGSPDLGFQVKGDPDQLRQAFLNIGVNALECMKGKGKLRFSFHGIDLPRRTQSGKHARTLDSQQGVVVEVENDGPPLTEEEKEKVFTPFFTTKQKGLGLGMAITQKILRYHGGDVSCSESQDLGGARFRVMLPIQEESRVSTSSDRKVTT